MHLPVSPQEVAKGSDLETKISPLIVWKLPPGLLARAMRNIAAHETSIIH
jgi:hypothetical protein